MRDASAEIALLKAGEALDRPEIREGLERLRDAGMPLVSREGRELSYDLGSVLACLDRAGMVDFFRDRVRFSIAFWDQRCA